VFNVGFEHLNVVEVRSAPVATALAVSNIDDLTNYLRATFKWYETPPDRGIPLLAARTQTIRRHYRTSRKVVL